MHILTPALAAALLLASAAAAQAQTAPDDAPVQIPSAAKAAPGPAALGADELSGLNARQGTQTVTILSEQDLTAVNRGNTITAHTVDSGAISIGPNAFQGFAGVGNFVINSGHQNNLQGALTINVVSP